MSFGMLARLGTGRDRRGVPPAAGNSASTVTAATWIFRLGAISNFLVTLPAFVAYDAYVKRFTDTPPRYPFLVRIWSGMAFLWGVMFWEISRDPVGKRPLIKYAYLEKAIVSTSVTGAFLIGEVPGRLMATVLLTDVIWIPFFGWAHLQIVRISDD